MKKEDNRIVAHVASLVLGIISIVSMLFWYISVPSGVIAIVLGTKSYKKFGKKLGLGGMITVIVGLSLCVLIYVSLLILVYLENQGF